MTSLKVAVRVRPLSERESLLGSNVVVDVQGKDILISDAKVPENHGCDHRVRVHRFTFDFGFWSVDSAAKKYASQKTVYEEFGRVVLNTVLQGYNSCVIAYGPSGSGKTYTMMGSKEENGLTPRICEGLFTKLSDKTDNHLPFQIDISFMEIYNEQVFDLLQKRELGNNRKQPKLRIREHPIHGPFVEGLSTHVVKNIDDVCDLLARGNECRVNAATHIHDRSSRSHAIFTIRCSQARINEFEPREVVSKLHLVDLAGSEKAAPEFCQSRVKEGGNINKSLVTLGNVISVLVELSLRSKQGETNTKQTYVPYRDSHLTWLLKDSLGGNSHTFMLAAISPSKECYIETVSTLRYAQRAKLVMNKPVVNEDPGTEMIRNLQTEVKRLRNLLLTAEKMSKKYTMKPLPDIIQLRNIMEESSRRVDLMTKQWFEKWLETYDVVLSKVIKKEGPYPKRQVTGLKDDKYIKSINKRKSSTKTTPSEKVSLIRERNSTTSLNSNKEGLEDSSECFILCSDMVGFSKKSPEEFKDNKCAIDRNSESSISDEKEFPVNYDYKNDCRKKRVTSTTRNYKCNSDNVLYSRSPSYNMPLFRFLSLGGMNITYPYCNYSWIAQNRCGLSPESENGTTVKNSIDKMFQVSRDFQEMATDSKTSLNYESVKHDQVISQDISFIHTIENCEPNENFNFQNEMDHNCFQNERSDILDSKSYIKVSSLETLDQGTNDSLDLILTVKEENGNEDQENMLNEALDGEEEIIEKEVVLVGSNEIHTSVNNINEEMIIEPTDNPGSVCVENETVQLNSENTESEKVLLQDTFRSELKYNEQVREESENVVDLLIHLNHESRDQAPGVHLLGRKDSEIMSLLSFSSLDCPVWKSLDDFLVSSEETSSIQEDDRSESLYHNMLDKRRYSIQKASFSSVDSNMYSGLVSANVTKEIVPEENDSADNVPYDLIKRNSRHFKQVKFNTLPNTIDSVVCSVNNVENGSLVPQDFLNLKNNPPEKYESNLENNETNHNSIPMSNNNINEKVFSNADVTLVSEVNKNVIHFSSNDECVPIVRDYYDESSHVVSENIGIIVNAQKAVKDGAENDSFCQKSGIKFWPENSNHALKSVSGVGPFKSSGLKLTKANLDLLAEKLHDSSETNSDYINACIAYALDVNNATQVLNSIQESDDGNDKSVESFSIPEYEIERFNEKIIIETLVNRDKSTSAESLESLKSFQNYETKNTCALEKDLERETAVALENEKDIPLIVENKMENKINSDDKVVLETKEWTEMWKRNFFETKVVGESEKREKIVTDNNYADRNVKTIEISHVTNLNPLNEKNDGGEMTDTQSQSLLNNTFTSDSLDNFEQEMIDWANKYLTKCRSNSSSFFIPETNIGPQSIDAQEFGLKEFEFCTESGKFDNKAQYKSTFDEFNGEPDSCKNIQLPENPAFGSSKSSSSDSITYVFVGAEDNDLTNTNIPASISQYSSLPSSVSLDSLERSAYRPKFHCLSPRTLSIDSLVAEELLAQLRSGELPPVSKTDYSLQAEEKIFPGFKPQFKEYLSDGTHDNLGNIYKANITETLSPESNCSFDTLNIDNNKEGINPDKKLCSKINQDNTIDEACENSFETVYGKLQKLPLGVSELLVNEVRKNELPVKKSATNSEIYKSVDTHKSEEKSEKTTSSYNSAVNKKSSEIGIGENLNLENITKVKNCNIKSQSLHAENEYDVPEPFLVPPPTSFTNPETTLFKDKFIRKDQSTQTEASFPSNSSIDEQKSYNALPSNTLDLILRMMEMMTETIKYLKEDKARPAACCGGCAYRVTNPQVRRFDYYDEITAHLHENSSISSESSEYIPKRVRSANRPVKKQFVVENIDDKRNNVSTHSCHRHRKKYKTTDLNTTVERFSCPSHHHHHHHHHHHTIPFDYRNRKLHLKNCSNSFETKRHFPSALNEHNSFLPLQELDVKEHTKQKIYRSAVNGAMVGVNDLPSAKLSSVSEMDRSSPLNPLSQSIKICQEVVEANKHQQNNKSHICCNKKLHHERYEILEFPSLSDSSSSEGYLSSMSSVRTRKRLSDDTDSLGMGDMFKNSPVSKPSTSKVKTLKPLVLNRRPEDQRAAMPSTSWQNTSADSGAFFMDSPLAENKNFSNANRSPESSVLPFQPLFNKTNAACEPEINIPVLKGGLTYEHLNYHYDDTSSNISKKNCFPMSTSIYPSSSVQRDTSSPLSRVRLQGGQDTYGVTGHSDFDEGDLDIKQRNLNSPACAKNSTDASGENSHFSKNTTSEEFATKLSDKNYHITREDIERILASIEADKQFLRSRRNPVFERRYSPEVTICSPFGEEDELFLSDSYKRLPKPVLYLNSTKDTSVVT